jgi:hypothetical protein
MNPQIPTKPCVVCGVKTNETQSIIGIAHYKCFAKPEPPKPICDKLAVCQLKMSPSCPVGVCKLAFLAGVVG